MRKKHTTQEKNALAMRVKNGDHSAWPELERAMLYMVVGFALKARGWSGGVADLEDLKASAWEVVFECTKRFDPDREGADFSGMCYHWIPEKLGRDARESGIVRLGRGRVLKKASMKLRGLMSEYESQGLSVEQSLQEAAKILNISELDAAHTLIGAKTTTIGVEEGEHEPVSEEPLTVDVVSTRSMQGIVHEVLSGLSEEDQALIMPPPVPLVAPWRHAGPPAALPAWRAP